MADKKISALLAATTPLAGTEVLPIVQSGATVKVSIADVTAGRAVSAASITLGTALAVPSGGTGATTLTGIVKGNGTSAFTAGTVALATEVTGTLPIANGGTGATTAGTARTSLGATTVGGNLFTLTNPSAITFPRFNADNTVSALDAATFRTAIGALSGFAQSSSPFLTSVGSGAGGSSVTGINNSFFGASAGQSVTSGTDNVAFGESALLSNSTSNSNTAVGSDALRSTLSANGTAVGFEALRLCTGSGNTAVGAAAGSNLTTGTNNTIIGASALASSGATSNEVTLGNSSVTNFRIPGVGFSFNTFSGVVVPKTITAAGTTGAQTINKTAGSVNFAAAATSLVVTNSFVTTNSVIVATVATNDSTMKSVAVVAASGSFTLHANAAATAETRVNWFVAN